MSAVAHIKQYKTGAFYADEFRGDISWNGYEHNVLLRNDGRDASGNLRFTDIGMAVGADDEKDGRGMARAQEVQAEMAETRIGAGLGNHRADTRRHVDAA